MDKETDLVDKTTPEELENWSPVLFYTYVFLTILFWSSSYVGIRYSVTAYSPESLASLRFITASLFLIIYALLVKMRLPDLKDLPLIFLNGLLGFFLYNIILNKGEISVAAGTASFLISTAPIFTGLFSLFLLKEKPNRYGWFGMVISFCGISLISFTEGEIGKLNMGVILVLTSSILISIYTVLQRFLLKKYSPLEATTYSIMAGTVFLLIYIPEVIKDIETSPLPITLSVIYLGIFPAALGYLFWSHALSMTTSTVNVASFMYVTPVLTMGIGWIWIDEMLGLYSITGGMIVLAGVIITQLSQKKNKL